MVRGLQILGAREPADQLSRVVDEQRKMLGTDPQGGSPIFQGDEGSFLGAPVASHAIGLLLCISHRGILPEYFVES
jgi:hypothetical protein